MNPYEAGPAIAVEGDVAAYAGVDARAEFITKTYLHLVGAVCAWVAIIAGLLIAIPEQTAMNVVGTMLSGYAWLLVLGAFMIASTVANRWALSAVSLQTQYMGLGLYVVAQSLITYPLIFIAYKFYPVGTLPTAAFGTLAIFAGLTGIVFATRKDFSFMGAILGLLGMVALGLIVVSILFGFALGPIFTIAMIGLMAGYILYDTSNVLHHFHTTQYVAASLALFSSLATLFWYVLQLVMSMSRDYPAANPALRPGPRLGVGRSRSGRTWRRAGGASLAPGPGRESCTRQRRLTRRRRSQRPRSTSELLVRE